MKISKLFVVMCVGVLWGWAGGVDSVDAQEVESTKHADELNTSIKEIRKLAEFLISENKFMLKENFIFRHKFVRLLSEYKMDGKSAIQAQQISVNILGRELYDNLESRYIGYLNSGDSQVQAEAARVLGTVLFSLDARNRLKGLVFNRDKTTQIRAVEALFCLDEPGGLTLLEQAVLSGMLYDGVSASLLKTVYIKDVFAGKSMAFMVCKKMTGAMTVKTALPMIKDRSDYLMLVRTVFLSDKYSVPHEHKLSLKDQLNMALYAKLMWIILTHNESFKDDAAVRNKLQKYARRNDYSDIYGFALLALEHLGESESFFTEMLARDDIHRDKREIISQIVERLNSASKKQN